MGSSATSLWLNLDRDLAIRIKHQDLPYFPAMELKALLGRQIEARGKLYYHNKKLHMRLYYGADLRILKTTRKAKRANKKERVTVKN